MTQEIEEIIDALSHCDFTEVTEYSFREQIIYIFGRQYKKKFSYDNGASKGVFIFKDLDFVIKIPFIGTIEIDEDEEYDSEFLQEFCGADGKDSCWDYCSVEKERYHYAEIEGVEMCLAKTKLLTTIQGYPIYIQEYATMYDYGESSCHTIEDTYTVKKICEDKNYSCFNEEWLSDVFSFFGEKIFYKLLSWIDMYEVNDLHANNLGYIHGRPVLVDYSGWDY